MSKKFSIGSMNQLADALESENYSDEDVTGLRGVLSQLKLVLAGVATIVRHCLKLVLPEVFNPSEFIGSDWRVWKGPANGDGLSGAEDSVQEPDTIDFEQLVLETHLRKGETSLHGEEKMKRARESKNLQLGGRAFLSLWNDWISCKEAGKPEDSVLERLRKSKKIGNVIYFFGLILRGPVGHRSVLCLYPSGGGWYWGYGWLVNHWCVDGPSVALASV